MRHGRWIAAGLLLVTLAACTGDGDGSDAGNDGASVPDSEYLVLSDPTAAEWDLQEALEVVAGDPAARIDPTMTWFAEYVRTRHVTGGSEGQLVVVSGYHLARREKEANLVGFELERVTVGDWDARGGDMPTDSGSPQVILLAAGNRTFMLLSYELSLKELTEFADALDPADEAAWAAAGGITR